MLDRGREARRNDRAACPASTRGHVRRVRRSARPPDRHRRPGLARPVSRHGGGALPDSRNGTLPAWHRRPCSPRLPHPERFRGMKDLAMIWTERLGGLDPGQQEAMHCACRAALGPDQARRQGRTPAWNRRCWLCPAAAAACVILAARRLGGAAQDCWRAWCSRWCLACPGSLRRSGLAPLRCWSPRWPRCYYCVAWTSLRCPGGQRTARAWRRSATSTSWRWPWSRVTPPEWPCAGGGTGIIACLSCGLRLLAGFGHAG